MDEPSAAGRRPFHDRDALVEVQRLVRCVEQMVWDETADVRAMKPLMDEARALGRRWARSRSSDHPVPADVLAAFGLWLDLESAFIAGIHDFALERAGAAEDDAIEQMEAQIAQEIHGERMAYWLATLPGLPAWCRSHPRATHVWGPALFAWSDEAALRRVLEFLVAEDADITRNGGGPFCVVVARRGWSTKSDSLWAALAASCERVARENHLDN